MGFLRDMFGGKGLSEEEMGINPDKYKRPAESAELPRLSDGPLWHAFADVSEAGVMEAGAQEDAHARMNEFFERHPGTEKEFEGLSREQAREQIAQMDAEPQAEAA